ncbi:MAG: glycosyltransferase [Bacteroidota bacterium]
METNLPFVDIPSQAPQVIHLVLGLPDPRAMAGVNVVVHHMAFEAHALGLDVSVWSLNDVPKNGYDPGYPLEVFIRNQNRFQVPDRMKAAIQALPEDTLFHIHAMMTPELRAFTRLLKKRGLSWVVTPHASISFRSLNRKWWVKYPYLFFFDRPALSGAKWLHALGEIEARELRLWNRRVKVIPNGIAVNDIRPLQRHEEDPLIFGFLGRIALAHKGLDLLWAGFRKYRQQGGKGLLWIIGGGGEFEAFSQEVKDSPEGEAVVFHGPKYGEEKFALLQKCQVFVHTSRWEGMPMSVLEAAAMGKALLVSPQTNMGQLVQSYAAGEVLPENHPDQIALALESLEKAWEQGRLETQGINARKMITDSLNWPEVVKKLAQDIYLT